MYGIEDLKELAMQKFARSFRAVIPDDLHGVLEAVFGGELDELIDTVVDVAWISTTG